MKNEKLFKISFIIGVVLFLALSFYLVVLELFPISDSEKLIKEMYPNYIFLFIGIIFNYLALKNRSIQLIVNSAISYTISFMFSFGVLNIFLLIQILLICKGCSKLSPPPKNNKNITLSISWISAIIYLILNLFSLGDDLLTVLIFSIPFFIGIIFNFLGWFYSKTIFAILGAILYILYLLSLFQIDIFFYYIGFISQIILSLIGSIQLYKRNKLIKKGNYEK